MITFVMPALLIAAAPDSDFKPIAGPAMLCLKYGSFQLQPGETVTRATLGVESMSLAIDGPSGGVTIRESEILANPPHRRLYRVRADARISRIASGSYVFYGPASLVLHGAASKGAPDRPYAVVVGATLGTGRRDAILDRFKLGIPAPESCGHRFLYGWEYMLPAETQ